MKKFEEPIIVDALECVEGVYLRSGNTDTPPDTPNGGNWDWEAKIEHNDTGTLSGIHIRGKSKNSGDGETIIFRVLDSTVTIEETKSWSLPLGFTKNVVGNSIILTTNSHYNPNEGVDISFECVFGGTKNGAYGEGGHTLSEAEKCTKGIFELKWT